MLRRGGVGQRDGADAGWDAAGFGAGLGLVPWTTTFETGWEVTFEPVRFVETTLPFCRVWRYVTVREPALPSRVTLPSA